MRQEITRLFVNYGRLRPFVKNDPSSCNNGTFQLYKTFQIYACFINDFTWRVSYVWNAVYCAGHVVVETVNDTTYLASLAQLLGIMEFSLLLLRAIGPLMSHAAAGLITRGPSIWRLGTGLSASHGEERGRFCALRRRHLLQRAPRENAINFKNTVWPRALSAVIGNAKRRHWGPHSQRPKTRTCWRLCRTNGDPKHRGSGVPKRQYRPRSSRIAVLTLLCCVFRILMAPSRTCNTWPGS